MEANSKSVEENTGGLNQRRDSDHTIVANPILVESPTEDETISNTSSNAGQSQMDVDRMDVSFKKRIKQRLTIQDVEYLSQSNRTKTHKAYDHGWRIWTNWCKRNGFELQAYNSKAVYWFPNAHNHLSTPTLNVHRPSIASVFNIIHEKGRPVADFLS
ncbi:hypothetical protein G6F43_009811 [Rhizopus delemar]|nr:hypothetical protein G6F43_009811 [Rhizopus delemar]